MLRSRTTASGKGLETSPPSNRPNFPVPRTGEAKVVPEQVTSRAEHPPISRAAACRMPGQE